MNSGGSPLYSARAARRRMWSGSSSISSLRRAIRGLALVFRAGGQAQDVVRVVVDLVATARQVEDHGARHLHGGVGELGVGALGRDRDALLHALDGGVRLVVVLELDEEVAQACVGSSGIAYLDRALGDVEEAGGFRVG